MTDNSINIRMIQHYMYCPRRYALLEINKDWNENAYVVSANLMHEHVHDGSHNFSDSKKIVRSAVSVYNDLPEYDLFGVTDCVEFIRDKNGIEINGLDGRFRVQIVEYKPKAPKGEMFHVTDAIQVYAQKICADFVWKCDSEAFLYYSDIRKRVKLPFADEAEKYDMMLKKYIAGMHGIIASHKIPMRKKGQKCSGCSIADVCFPKEKKYSVREIIMSMKGTDVN